MATQQTRETQATGEREREDGPEMDEVILRDLESRYAGLRCPIHNVTPGFELAPGGAPIERFCCQALSQIFRELRADEIAAEVGPEQGEKAREVAPLLAGEGAKTLR